MGKAVSNAKYVRIAELLKRRIQNSDYMFNTLPSAQKLAEDTGVSYLTARHAIRKLIEDKVLIRQKTGRLSIHRSAASTKRKLNVVYIRPAMDDFSIWDYSLRQTAEELNCGYRTISYTHEDDPLITESLKGDFDLIFLWIHHIDNLFIEKLKKNSDRIVIMFHDLTEHGIRCVDGLPPETVSSLIEHLYKLGHRRIDCFNSQPISPTVEKRIELWRTSLEKFGCRGELHNHPVHLSFPTVQAYEKMNEVLESGHFQATAIFCTAMEGAQGIIRSCHEHRVHVPGDISVCSFGNPEKAMLSIPSITIVDRPDPKPELRAIFELFLGLSGDTDRLMYRPEGYNSLRLGESTGKAPPKPKEFAADVNGKNAPGKFASQGAMRMPLS
jgi:DNA-binding LacI/PurR family transcriptional regulator